MNDKTDFSRTQPNLKSNLNEMHNEFSDFK
jgi:hypothetical protein